MIDWTDLLCALGLAAAIEGAFYALMPESMRRALSEFLSLPLEARRMIGVACCAIGVMMVWLARG